MTLTSGSFLVNIIIRESRYFELNSRHQLPFLHRITEIGVMQTLWSYTVARNGQKGKITPQDEGGETTPTLGEKKMRTLRSTIVFGEMSLQ